MQPIEFKEQNIVIAKDQPQYKPLPALVKQDSPENEVICCWGLNWKERLTLLFTGRIWVSMWRFDQPLQPHRLTTVKGEVIPKLPTFAIN